MPSINSQNNERKDPFGIFKLTPMEDYFRIKSHGLSEDMENFILEESCDHREKTFFHSFYNVCADMLSHNHDLSDKQLRIVYREYQKEKADRIKSYAAKLERYNQKEP